MSVNLSTVSGAASLPYVTSANAGAASVPTPTAAKSSSPVADTAVEVVNPKPVEIPVSPPKTFDFSAQVKAQQQALQQALEELNQQAAQSKISVGFNLDHASGLQYVQVTNSHTGDVVMQFPTNKMLDVAASIEQLKGMLYNKKA